MTNYKIEEQNSPWIILDNNTISEADYIIWSDDKIEIDVNENENKFYYNQWKKREPKTNWSCWPFGSVGALSDLTWIEATEEDLLRINKLAIEKYWLKIPWGMYMHKAVDCIRDDYNTRHIGKRQIISIRCTIGDEVFIEALKKWHSLIVWYRTSTEYYKDSQDDWVINKDDYPKNGWHLVRTNFKEFNINIDDNYFWTKKYNTYINNKILELKKNWVFFPSAYLFLYKETMEDKIRDNIDLEGAKIQFDKKNWNWLNPREPISRQENMTVAERQEAKYMAIIKKLEDRIFILENKNK